MSKFYTGTGDNGYTGLLGDERVPKSHPKPEAYGALDEASAALGLARAVAQSEISKGIVREIQRDLYHIMAELAATREQAEKFRRVKQDRVIWLESKIDQLGKEMKIPGEFVLPGDSEGGAAFDLARTIIRRAERRVAELGLEGELEESSILPYLNRLSSLCFLLGLWENKQAGVEDPTLAKTGDE